MKEFEVTIWRSNPQLPNGGYEKKVIEKGKTAESVARRLERQFKKCLYGSKEIIYIQEI